MPETTHAFIVEQTGDTHVVAAINGIPIHDVKMPNETTRAATKATDHWLMPGDNHLTLDVKEGVVGPATSVNATIWDGVQNKRLAEVHWPQDFGNDPADKAHGAAPRGPVSKPFSVSQDHPRPIYMDAPAHKIPPNGSKETWAPIRDFHDAFVRGDKAGVTEGLSLRASNWYKYYQAPMSSPAALDKLVSESVPGPYKMLPLDPDMTRFEPYMDGRIYRVIRADGLPLITGKCLTGDVKPCLLESPFLIFDDNRFRIFF